MIYQSKVPFLNSFLDTSFLTSLQYHILQCWPLLWNPLPSSLLLLLPLFCLISIILLIYSSNTSFSLNSKLDPPTPPPITTTSSRFCHFKSSYLCPLLPCNCYYSAFSSYFFSWKQMLNLLIGLPASSHYFPPILLPHCHWNTALITYAQNPLLLNFRLHFPAWYIRLKILLL